MPQNDVCIYHFFQDGKLIDSGMTEDPFGEEQKLRNRFGKGYVVADHPTGTADQETRVL